MKKLAYLFWMLLLALPACAPAHTPDSGKDFHVNVIVRFADTSARPADSRFVEILSQQVNATLVYLRPMSGAAHVFEVRGLRDAAELQEVLRRLAKQPGVTYAEEDSVRRKQ